MNKVTLPYENFKRMSGGGNRIKMIEFLTKQRIGKVEFTSKPWSYKDNSGDDRITKWVVDIENGKFLKLVNGKVDYDEKISLGSAIGEIVDLISNDEANDYSSVNLFRRKSIPGKSPDTFKNEDIRMKSIKLVETIVRKQMRRKLVESVSKDALKAYLAAAI